MEVQRKAWPYAGFVWAVVLFAGLVLVVLLVREVFGWGVRGLFP